MDESVRAAMLRLRDVCVQKANALAMRANSIGPQLSASEREEWTKFRSQILWIDQRLGRRPVFLPKALPPRPLVLRRPTELPQERRKTPGQIIRVDQRETSHVSGTLASQEPPWCWSWGVGFKPFSEMELVELGMNRTGRA